MVRISDLISDLDPRLNPYNRMSDEDFEKLCMEDKAREAEMFFRQNTVLRGQIDELNEQIKNLKEQLNQSKKSRLKKKKETQ